MSSLGDAIRSTRARLGLSQDDFSSRLGVARNTLSQYETGSVVPSVRVLLDLMRVPELTREEKEAVLDALAPSTMLGQRPTEDDVREANAFFDAFLHSNPRATAPRGPRRSLRQRFGTLATKVVNGEARIDENILSILEMWVEYGRDRGQAGHFREAANYLKVMTSVRDRKSGGKLRRRARRHTENGTTRVAGRD